MGCEDTTIVLAQDVTLESYPDGSAQVHYMQPSTFGMAQGAKALRLMGLVLANNDPNTSSYTDGTIVRFTMDASYDGRTWSPSQLPFDGREQPASSGNPVSALGEFDNLYVGQPTLELSMPFIRFGIEVSNGSNTKGEVRLSAIVVAIRRDVPAYTRKIADEFSIQNGQADEPVRVAFSTEPFNTMEINGFVGTAPTDNITLQPQISCVTSGQWVDVGSGITISSTAPFATQITELATYARFVYTSGADSATDLDLHVTLKR